MIDPHSSLEDPLQGPPCIDKERCEPRLLQNPRIITEANKNIGHTTNNCKHKNKKKNQNKEKHENGKQQKQEKTGTTITSLCVGGYAKLNNKRQPVDRWHLWAMHGRCSQTSPFPAQIEQGTGTGENTELDITDFWFLYIPFTWQSAAPPWNPPPCQAKDSLRHWLKSICCLKSFKIATQSASSLQPWQKHERSPQNLSLFPFPQNSFAIQTNKSSKECLEHLKEPNFLNRLHLAGNSQ